MRNGLLVLVVGLASCGSPPLDPYFDEAATAPTVTSVEPDSVGDVLGGQTVTITGTGLDTTSTVVFGTRNAEIIEATATSVSVKIPSQPTESPMLDVALATDDGLARLEGAFSYDAAALDYVEDGGEDISVSITVEQCPMIVSAVDADDLPTHVWWCGPVGGRAAASAWKGAGIQHGYAGEMSPLGTLSELPDVGEVRLFRDTDPRDVPPPEVFDYLPEGARITITAEADWALPLGWLDEARDTLEVVAPEDLALTTSATFVEGHVDDVSVCFTDIDVVGGDGDMLFTATEPDAWDSVRVGYSVSGDLEATGWVAGADVVATDADGVTTGLAGVVLPYDFYTGVYDPERPPLYGDFPSRADYTITTRELEDTDVVRGTVQGGEHLLVLSPQLWHGDYRLDTSEDLTVRWAPSNITGDIFVSVVLRLMEGDTERLRLVGRGDDQIGEFTFTSTDMSAFPSVEPTTTDGQTLDRYAELLVTRHHLAQVDAEDDARTEQPETLVVDFVSAATGVVAIDAP